jgi:Na+/H+-translocating membrane pyrophosphatase
MLTISEPKLFIGMLIGGAVPFLFSSMTIRAVGRAAGLIVKEAASSSATRKSGKARSRTTVA